MMIEDKILLTARYAEGDLNEAEQAEFENRLQNDEELKQHLTDYNYIHQSLKMQLSFGKDDEQFEETLKSLNKQYFLPEPKVVPFKPYLKWVSGIAAALVIGLMIWAPWNGSLYQQYAGESQMLVAERGAEKVTDLDKAAAFYNEKKYAEAQKLLQKLNSQQPNDAMVGYYFAQTLVKTDQLAKAREILNPIYNGESIFKYDAAYLLAMSYLKEKNNVQCKLWLQQSPAGNTNYKKATELLTKL